MLDQSRYDYCSEFYIVEKAVQVLVKIAGNPETIRIEAHKIEAPKGNTGGYCTRSFIQREITIQPTYPQENGHFSKKPESITVWARFDLPDTDNDSADKALKQALGFLSERCGK